MSESTTFDNLIAGTEKPTVTEPATVRTFESFSRGALLGRLTATEKWQVCDEDAKANFSLFGIASEAVDTTDGTERVTSVYVEGEFSQNAVIFSYSDVVSDWNDTLEAQGIYLRKTISTAGQ